MTSDVFLVNIEIFTIVKLRQPGIEPVSIAWKATMLAFTPPTHTNAEVLFRLFHFMLV